MRTIIKNGTVVTTEDTFRADIQIDNERITGIFQDIIPSEEDRVINAEGQFVMPGGIDVHTHLNTHDFDSGTIAAATGGTTSLINMTPLEKGQSLADYMKDWKTRAASSVIDYGFHLMIPGDCYRDDLLDELPDLADQSGVTSIKLFFGMAYRENGVVNDAQAYKVMKKASELGLMVNVHAENGQVINEIVDDYLRQGKVEPIYHALSRPTQMEAEATGRAIAIAEITGASVYVVHVSSADALEQIRMAQKRGVRVYGETCPQYLVFDESYLTLPGLESAKYVCVPPLRQKWNQDALWTGINAGVLSVVGSDHCPFNFKGKKTGGIENFSQIPNGVPGIEDRFLVMYEQGVHQKRISLQKFVDIMCTKPAKLFGLTKKGAIQVGSDADIVLLDPRRSKIISQKTQKQKLDYNLFEGMEVHGVISNVLSRGELIIQEEQFIGTIGRGRYIRRSV
ncbi:dihydropyrimidinase [Paenibacillus sp. sgz302251]|uniref:dihydropyrimidinase n=1 Tax=Paenibacillus sp. sgz302251 TaxID=3414493 RepID=UPI003C7AA99B